jgi:hypothetical protein
MTPLQKGYATLESGTFLANTHVFCVENQGKRAILDGKVGCQRNRFCQNDLFAGESINLFSHPLTPSLKWGKGKILEN